MDVADALFAEYKTVRQESLEAVSRLQTVAQYALAATGVGIGLGLVSASRNVTAGAVVLMGLIPLLVIFGIAMIGLEIQRVLSTRQHLRGLEQRINYALAPNMGPVLSWEATRNDPKFRVINLYPLALAVAILAAILVGPVIGGVILGQHGRWIGFSLGVGLDILALAAVVVASVRAFRRLRDLETDDASSESPRSVPSTETERHTATP